MPLNVLSRARLGKNDNCAFGKVNRTFERRENATARKTTRLGSSPELSEANQRPFIDIEVHTMLVRLDTKYTPKASKKYVIDPINNLNTGVTS